MSTPAVTRPIVVGKVMDKRLLYKNVAHKTRGSTLEDTELRLSSPRAPGMSYTRNRAPISGLKEKNGIATVQMPLDENAGIADRVIERSGRASNGNARGLLRSRPRRRGTSRRQAHASRRTTQQTSDE